MRKVTVALLVLVMVATLVGTTVAQAPSPLTGSGKLTKGVTQIAAPAPQSVLWDQPTSTVYPYAFADQDFSDLPTYSAYVADDFQIGDAYGWTIGTIFVPGDMWNWAVAPSLATVESLNWSIYADNGGVPAGDPSGAGAPPLWTLTLPPADPQVVLSSGYSGLISDATLNLATPVNLPVGTYWLLFWPRVPFTNWGQFGRLPADTTNLTMAQWVNPGGSFGIGTAWQPWSNLDPSVPHDSAFRLEGGVNPPPATMHIASIQMVKQGVGPWRLTAKGQIHDGAHALLPGVLVTGQWTLPNGTKVNRQFTTTAQGAYQFVYQTNVTGTYRFCIIQLAKAGYTYVKADNHMNPPCRQAILP